MTTRVYGLADEFIDQPTERALLAALARDPPLFWDLAADLPDDAFAVEREAWIALRKAIEDGVAATAPAGWEPAADPKGAVARLRDLHEKRIAAALLEQMLARLHAKDGSATGSLLEGIAREADAARRKMCGAAAGTLLWADDLLASVLGEACEAMQRKEETGEALVGFSSGLRTLDDILGGLRQGQIVLAGGPGAGKTTLACQIAMHVAAGGNPVVYVTYENSPQHLLLRILCADAGIRTVDVERGRADLARLSASAERLRPALARLALVDGHSQLRVAQVRSMVRRALDRSGAERGLVVFDYLQRAAHGHGYEQLRHNVSALAGELRDVSKETATCVLCLSSQNRAGGGYGDGPGSTSLDSLKESGDLEYGADVVLFLVKSERRQADPPSVAMDLVVSKNRLGQSGMRIPLQFRPDRGDLREVARQ